MFPVIHGILAQSQEEVSCVYPLDATQEQLAPLDLNVFEMLDECGHKLRANGTGPFLALSEVVMDSLLTAQPIPSSEIIPPQNLGDGIFAVEYLVDIGSVEQIDESQAGYVKITLGTYRPEDPNQGGGNIVGYFSANEGSYGDTGIYGYWGGGDGLGAFLGDQDPNELMRVGIYFNTITGLVGFSLNGNDVGYQGEYTKTEPLVHLVSVDIVLNSNIKDLTIDTFTHGKDLQFTYPEGTVGLDGEPAPNQPQPDPIPEL